MASGMFWVPLLLFIMKQTHADSEQFMDSYFQNFDLEKRIYILAVLKQQKENLYKKFEVSIYINIYIETINFERYILITTGLKHGNELLVRQYYWGG